MTIATQPAGTRPCPKCGHISGTEVRECPKCQVVIDKAVPAEDRRRGRSPEGSLGDGFSLERLLAAEQVVVRQQVERLEAFVGIETANLYSVMDGLGNVLFLAVEESGSTAQFVTRVFLKAARPFTIHLQTPRGDPVLTVERPFRFYFHEVRTRSSDGRVLASVQRQFSLFNTRYALVDGQGRGLYELFGSPFRPWTFRIRKHGQDCGVIRKKWSGLLKEAFTDADSFGVEFPRGIDVERKVALLGAVFLIDFAHFEDNNRN